ncbi:Auxin Efflux Carrier [Thiorhodococcus drewsii AZ1]|uniref:Auxin Efflux Carrier n=1 Tax=Thiorhodococcus drewsii AZ1 TaxID=765913 RepID=G2DWW7_9GAMM|nr:AEC family transporter [Thiorhodococcus drewsii]EGV33321.1 Auxin Efflux Carrier [Thiorhodococcus drewsii AZ1]
MHGLLTNLEFALSVTGPIMLVLALGVWLTQRGLLTDAFADVGSRLVFNVTLPILLFITISQTHYTQAANLRLLAVGLMGTLVSYLLFELIAAVTVAPRRDRGVVVQGAFRANMGIVGLAYCVNAYGDVAMATAALYLGVVTLFFNVLAVITLNRSLSEHRSLVPILKDIARNPLIIAILSALPFAYFEVRLPDLLLQTGEYFAQMTLPLALLCTGGSMSLRALHLDSRNALIGAFGKVVVTPLVVTGMGYLAGLRGIELGILFLMSSAPTAAASYVMARAMGGNAALAANIIVLSTIGSMAFTSLGITLLHTFGLIR